MRAVVTEVRPVEMYEVVTEHGQLPYRVSYSPRAGEVVCVNPVTWVIMHSVEQCDCVRKVTAEAK